MKQLTCVAPLIFAIGMTACGAQTKEQQPVLAVTVDLPRSEAKAFTDVMTRLAKEQGLRIDGPDAMPGKGADDYIAVLRAERGVSVSVYTNSKYESGDLTFYCTRGQATQAANTELKRLVGHFAQAIESGWPGHRISAFSGYGTNRKELQLHAGTELAAFLENAAACDQ